ncbi:ankyrin repeat domain-containing protein SOWAHC isoform X2 [Erinaceus europaeus]|nr:ankyrin repeat domain-containing protein SOWAHC isoform X2 [Erinaceus europaeus]
MEVPAALGSEAVVSFLAARGGRARHAELVQHFRAALGGEPEQRALARARFKEQVNAVATVRTDPADGSKYVHLKGQPGAASPAPPPAEEEARVAADVPLGPTPGGGTRRKDGRRDRPPPPREDAAPGCEDAEVPAPGCEDADDGSLPGPPRPARPGLRDHVPAGSPQPRRSPCPGARAKAGDPDSASLASADEDGAGSVALDPLEHAWMLSASDGRWDSLQGLLSCEPGLLAKRDFITGFSCLHWAAKHGRHELLALLVNFANQHRLPVDINARTSGGYTALHLAAMHGHVEVVKLLVGAYDADVDVRDYSGRKASQYLSQSTTEEIKSLVGALEEGDTESTASSGGGRWRLSKVLPSHLITYRLSHGPEEGGDRDHHHHHHHHHHHLTEGWAAAKAKDSARKTSSSSSGRIKPRLNRIRFRTQIIHTTPSFRDPEQPLEECEEEEDDDDDQSVKAYSSSSSFKLRPKSNVFG